MACARWPHCSLAVTRRCADACVPPVLLQYALDYYPPFASGCGFILSRDLVQALTKQPVPDYRLLVRC